MPVVTRAMMRPTTFPQFSNLPGELQTLVWRHAFYNTRWYDAYVLRIESAMWNLSYHATEYTDIGIGIDAVHISKCCGIPDLLFACGRSRMTCLETWIEVYRRDVLEEGEEEWDEMLPQIEFTLSIMKGEGKWVRSEDVMEVDELEG